MWNNRLVFKISFKEFLVFLVGFSIGITIFFVIINDNKLSPEIVKYQNVKDGYEQDMADQLFNKIKILCWVFTHPNNHQLKVPHVRNTWGRKCNKLLFMSITVDPDHPDIIALPIENGRKHLWNKTKLAMKYVHDNYINDYDWFMRADDDKLDPFCNLIFSSLQL